MTSTPSFAVKLSRTSTAAVLALTGDLDVLSEPQWLDEIAAQCQQGAGAIVIDLAGVTFIDSSGLRLLIRGKHIAGDAGAAFRLANPPAPVQRLFEMTGLADEFEIDTDTDAATDTGD